jgi:aminopeptidase N
MLLKLRLANHAQKITILHAARRCEVVFACGAAVRPEDFSQTSDKAARPRNLKGRALSEISDMKRIVSGLMPAVALTLLAAVAPAQTTRKPRPVKTPVTVATPAPTPLPAPTPNIPPPPANGRSRYDITHYRIEAQLLPGENGFRAGAEITLTPLDSMRSIIFELNGSLKLETAERNGKPLTNFAQDPVGIDNLGPNVRIDLGELLPPNAPFTMRLKWSGALTSPEGGPLLTKRLAYVGSAGSYLMYPARWFPFHDYAADAATSDISLIVPVNTTVAGASDEPVVAESAGAGLQRFRFVQKTPNLPGNFIAGPYIATNLRYGAYEVAFYTKIGSEGRAPEYAETIGRALETYTQKYGEPVFGKRLVVAQIDDASLEAYSAPGMIFLSNKLFEPSRPVPQERLQRETAYQWWGLSVGLKNFDDAWLSQGLAEWSAFALRESTLKAGALDAAQREMQERALTFEQTSSIALAPSKLDDQSAAYQSIMFYKGAMVYRMLRSTLGAQSFDRLLRQYFQQFRGRSASLEDFEKLTTQIAGQNMRYFFAQWLESTGVPEFTADYQIIRTRSGKFRSRGTVRQTLINLNLPVEVAVRAEGDNKTVIVQLEDKSGDFDVETKGQPLEVVVDPNNKILRLSDELRVAVLARKGIDLSREGNYSEAQQQLEAALKLDKNNSWIYYNLGLLYLEQRNWTQAEDNFKAALAGDLRPSWVDVWARIKLGNTYDGRGDRARAVDQYNKAVDTGIDYDNAAAAAKRYLATPYNPREEQAINGR